MATDILCPVCEEELVPPAPGTPSYRCPDGCGSFTLAEIATMQLQRDIDTGRRQ